MMINELHSLHHSKNFDALPCPKATYGDLDQTLINLVFERAGQTITKAKLKTLKILVPYGQDYVPSNAGVILFSKRQVRENPFPMAYVSCARFDRRSEESMFMAVYCLIVYHHDSFILFKALK